VTAAPGAPSAMVHRDVVRHDVKGDTRRLSHNTVAQFKMDQDSKVSTRDRTQEKTTANYLVRYVKEQRKCVTGEMAAVLKSGRKELFEDGFCYRKRGGVTMLEWTETRWGDFRWRPLNKTSWSTSPHGLRYFF